MGGLVYSPHPHLKYADVKIAATVNADVHTVLYWLAELVSYIDSRKHTLPPALRMTIFVDLALVCQLQ